jgi:DNA-binding response OmpR family regulator
MAMHILVVEDDSRMAALLRDSLTEDGQFVTLAHDGVTALDLALSYRFDVIVLDVMLPRLDGLAVAHGIRKAHNQTPILMLTARDTPADIVKALDEGADDYLVKPFSLEVLLARIRAVSRRGPIPQAVCLQAGDLLLNTATREVTRSGSQITLTRREYSLLECLMRRKSRVVSRQQIVETVWGFNSEIEENTLEAFIRLLRNKLDNGSSTKLIHTIRGVGYSLREPES